MKPPRGFFGSASQHAVEIHKRKMASEKMGGKGPNRKASWGQVIMELPRFGGRLMIGVSSPRADAARGSENPGPPGHNRQRSWL